MYKAGKDEAQARRSYDRFQIQLRKRKNIANTASIQKIYVRGLLCEKTDGLYLKNCRLGEKRRRRAKAEVREKTVYVRGLKCSYKTGCRKLKAELVLWLCMDPAQKGEVG